MGTAGSLVSGRSGVRFTQVDHGIFDGSGRLGAGWFHLEGNIGFGVAKCGLGRGCCKFVIFVVV